MIEASHKESVCVVVVMISAVLLAYGLMGTTNCMKCQLYALSSGVITNNID